MSYIQSKPARRKRRYFRAVVGGNQLSTRLKRELVGDHNVLDSLPDDHPRRKPRLAQLRLPFLNDEEGQP
jgi:hypothetical protein